MTTPSSVAAPDRPTEPMTPLAMPTSTPSSGVGLASTTQRAPVTPFSEHSQALAIQLRVGTPSSDHSQATAITRAPTTPSLGHSQATATRPNMTTPSSVQTRGITTDLTTRLTPQTTIPSSVVLRVSSIQQAPLTPSSAPVQAEATLTHLTIPFLDISLAVAIPSADKIHSLEQTQVY